MCTRDEILTFSEPVLFPSVPIAYVITMEGSNRYTSLLNELRTHRPTRTVVIVHHKPMSRCARPSWVTRVSDDLWRNNIIIAKRDPTVPVMIMEDDVRFLPRVHDYANHIDQMVAGNKCEIYSLGMLPSLSFPSSRADITVFLAGGFQAVLYSSRGRNRLVREYGNDPSYRKCTMRYVLEFFRFQWLHDIELTYNFYTLIPVRPCAVQSFPTTENQTVWRHALLSIMFHMSGAQKDGTKLFEMQHAIGRLGGCLPFVTFVVFVLAHVLKHGGVKR